MVLKRLVLLLLALLSLSCAAAPSFASEETVYGPKLLKIGWWGIHLSLHSFNLDEAGEGSLVFEKPPLSGKEKESDKKIQTGSVTFNGKLISLKKFFEGKEELFERQVHLNSKNRFLVYLQGNAGASVSVKVRRRQKEPPPAPEATFSAEPSNITSGESSTLSWGTSNAGSIGIEPGIGTVDATGSLVVSPTQTTTYTLSATGPGGSVSRTVTITVLPPPPQVEFNAASDVIESGGSCTLSWHALDGDTASIDNGIGTVALEGSISVSPTVTTTYTITVTGPGGSKSASVNVRVPTPPADVDFGIPEQGGVESSGSGGLVGETVCILNGNAVQTREDIAILSPHTMGLALTAAYNSGSNRAGSMGRGWTHNLEVILQPQYMIEGAQFVRIEDQTGRAHYFKPPDLNRAEDGLYQGWFKEKTRLSAEGTGYVWSLLNGIKYGFDTSGKLGWVEDEKGNRLEIAYNTEGLAETITDRASGRVLGLYYTAEGLLDHVTGPVTDAIADGIWVRYGYDGLKNLASVTYADGSGFRYVYGGSEESPCLTEKRDTLGHLLNTWSYDGQQRAVANFSARGKGVSIDYVSEDLVDVHDAYGVLRTYSIAKVGGRKRVVAMSGIANAPYSTSNAVRWAYDEQMRLVEVEYSGGRIYRFEDYDERGNPGTARVVSGTFYERVITYVFHPHMNVPLSRTEASVLQPEGFKITIWDYDDDGNDIPNENPKGLPCRIIERGFTRDHSGALIPYEYITILAYSPKGELLSVDGPLSGAQDTTSLSYDPETGDLLSVTRPLIGATTFTGHDGAGRPGRITDVNGQPQDMEYDARGRPTVMRSGTAGDATTTITYTLAGRPASITDPDNITRTFVYGAQFGRLLRILDPEGNSIEYQYDTQGNRIEMSKQGPDGTRTARKRWDYQCPSIPGRLFREIGADDRVLEYGYDDEGNISYIVDQNDSRSEYFYDPLNRITEVSRPGDAVTSYGYDIHGNLTSVTDAEGHETTYLYDDMARLVQSASPDTGTTSYVYDEAGDLASKMDAKGILVSYSYDPLKRLTAVRFPDPVDDILYSYDAGANGMGRLKEMNDPSGQLLFGYDDKGRVVEKTHIINDQHYTLTRALSPGGRVMAVIYPSGRRMDYTRDAMGRMSALSTTYSGNTTTLVSDMTYNPFGGPKGIATGTGGEVDNQSGECECIEKTNPGEQMERVYTYDGKRNLLSVTATYTPWYNQAFTYDGLDRLTSATGRYGAISYTYDRVGNRLSRDMNQQVDEYFYMQGTNKLEQITGPNPMAFVYDANGNTIGVGSRTLAYNQNNRLIRVEENGDIIAEYEYNGLGQRVIKDVQAGATVFHYGFDGQLIAESTPQGVFTKEYLYMGRIRMAMANPQTGAIYYYMNDRLGTPQIMTDANGEIVWMAAYKPFGEAQVHPNSTVTNNLRFPGQYFDQETGLHYNYHRYYDPSTGRYLTPDPFNLVQMKIINQSSLNRISSVSSESFRMADIHNFFLSSLVYKTVLRRPQMLNLYLYVLINPVNRIDPYGLWLNEIVGQITSVYVAIATESARQASLISGAGAGAVTIFTAPLSDLLFPSELNAGEREWLLDRERKEFREVMEQAKVDVEKLEKMYHPIFQTFGTEFNCEQ